MRLEQTPRQDQTLRVTTRLVTSSMILHLSADEMEYAINQEQAENPALEVKEQRICLFCSSPIYGESCTFCDRSTPNTPPSLLTASTTYNEASGSSIGEQDQPYVDIDNYSFAVADSDDTIDPLSLIATRETLTEDLLCQLEALVSPDDAPIAEQLVGNLNERGYLEIGLHEVAELLEVSIARVNYVLSQLHTLEPLGIGARNLRECLLIQIAAIEEISPPHPLARIIVDRYLEQLGHNQFAEIARSLKVAEREVRQASHYIRSMLHPFPAYIYHATINESFSGGTNYIHPDVIIRQGNNGFEIELMEEKRYNFTIEIEDQQIRQTLLSQRSAMHQYMYQNLNRARFFIDCVQRRWRTLRRVAEVIVTIQHEFLEKGVRYLHPLTRAQVAAQLNLDEGTVSRATAHKYALLPDGRLIPLADFFDGSLKIKDMLRELIQSENPRHRLSDEELARILTAQQIPLARRTITKYREEMGIGSSRERQGN